MDYDNISSAKPFWFCYVWYFINIFFFGYFSGFPLSTLTCWKYFIETCDVNSDANGFGYVPKVFNEKL